MNEKREQLTKTQQVERAITAAWKSIKGVVPEHVTPERLARIAVSAISRSDDLAKCSVSSLVEAITQGAILGLEANDGTGRAYLIPYKGTATLQIGYKGLLDLAYRSGLIDLVDAQVVYDGETFEAELGTEPRVRHVPTFNRGPMVGVYAVARVKGVEYPLVEVMGTEDIARVRAASQTSRSDSPWRIWPEEMARKSVLKRVLKRAPSSTEMRVAIGMIDDEAKGVPVEDVFPGAFDATKTGDKLADLTASLKQRTEPNPPPKADAKPATKKTPKPDPEPAQEREPGDDGWGSVPQPGDEDYL